MPLNHMQIVSIILVASVILLIDASTLLQQCHECWNQSNINWAIACSCVSLFISFVYLYGTSAGHSVVSAYAHYFAIFFLVWWTFGTGVVTFDNPYPAASNGYLASWAAWCMSFYFCIQTVESVGSAYWEAVATEKEKFTFGVLILASIVELIAGSVLCSKEYECKDKVAFSVAAGVISFVICIIYLASGDLFPLIHAAAILFIWWTISTGVLTFGPYAPFILVGNGYISTWICFIASLYLCHLGFGIGDKLGAFGGGGGGSGENAPVDDTQYEAV